MRQIAGALDARLSTRTRTSSVGDRIPAAITHDYLDQYGGAERTVLAICERLRSAPLYTSVYDRALMRRLGFSEPAQRIVVSFMQGWPLRRRVPRYYPTWPYPLAFRTYDLPGYELRLPSAHFPPPDRRLSPEPSRVGS